MRSTPLGIPMYLQSDTPKGQSAVKLNLNHTQCLEKSLQTLRFINALIIIVIKEKKEERGAKERERMRVGGWRETETERQRDGRRQKQTGEGKERERETENDRQIDRAGDRQTETVIGGRDRQNSRLF